MSTLKRGDKVPVRVHTGKVVEAVYLMESKNHKEHIVDIGGYWKWASYSPHDEIHVRFVGPSCDLEWSKAN